MGLMRKCGLPLPDYELDVLEPALHWEQLKVRILVVCLLNDSLVLIAHIVQSP